MLRSGRQRLFQAQHMRFKDTFLPVFRVPDNQDKLHPFQQTHSRKLLFHLLPPVEAIINGNAINCIKKLPGIRQVHVAACFLY